MLYRGSWRRTQWSSLGPITKVPAHQEVPKDPCTMDGWHARLNGKADHWAKAGRTMHAAAAGSVAKHTRLAKVSQQCLLEATGRLAAFCKPRGTGSCPRIPNAPAAERQQARPAQQVGGHSWW